MRHGIFRRIFALAERLEPDRKAVWEWVLHTPIEELGGHTAIALIFTDQGDKVVAFLKDAVCEEECATRVSSSVLIRRPHTNNID
jgi:hypothetical protein